MVEKRIAVVGAGVAGLTAARHLSRAGNEVVVFDKARGVGGRTSTRRRDPEAFDHGAQFFTCRGARFTAEVEDWCRRGVVARWTTPIHTLPRGRSRAEGDERVRYVGVPGMNALARDLASSLRVECGQKIEALESMPGGWRLRSGDPRDPGIFDAVVVATPAPQAAPLLAGAPELAKLVGSVEMQPCWAVMAGFPGSLKVSFGGAFVHESPLAWLARNSSKPERPDGESWVLHATPEWSAQHLEEAPDVVAALLFGAFEEALGKVIPPPFAMAAHRWLLARTLQPLGTPFLWDAERRLGVCGDWTQGARVEDAFNSGDLLADAMLDGKPRNAEV